MPSIPNTQRYYPSIPIYELTDLYSKGANTLGGKRVFIASYLPKTLRLSKDHPFNNQYILFVDDTPLVNSIDWEYQLHQNGEKVNISNFVSVIPSTEATKYSLFFAKDSIDAMRVPVADKLTVKCTVELGSETVVLEVEHDLVQALDNDLSNVEEDERLCAPHQGNPQTTEYILNHLKDFLPKGKIKWNDKLIEEDLTEEKENNLLKMVIGIIYYNIQSGINENAGFEFLYNIDQDRDKSIETFLNEGKTNEGDYTNGLCRIPLYVLNEILEDITSVPEFAEIDSGDGNPIFNIIRGQGETSTEEKIEASKTKLESDSERYIELFHLSLFPKSAIRLCALVVKYLFESSQKNECNECKYRLPAWKDVSFDELSEKPMFVRNILTLYLGGPTDKIKKILREAKRTKALIWSPFVDIIVNISPRMVKAYFAERVITKLDDEMIGGVATPVYTFAFKRIDAAQIRNDRNGVRLAVQPTYDAIVGREVFLIVETLHARGEELTMNISPINTVFNNSTDNLRLRNGIADGAYSTDITCKIGNTGDLVTNTFAPFGDTINEYLNIDFCDKAIVKLRLHPENSATYDAWTNHLAAATGQLMISGKFSDDRACYFGNDFSQTENSGEFLCANDKYMVTHFRVVNRIVYEVYHKDNPWNFFSNFGGNRKKQGRIDNEFIKTMADGSPHIAIRNVVFYYYSQINEEFFIDECAFSRPRRRDDRAVTIVARGANASNPANVPAGHIRDAAAPAGGDAFRNYYYADGRIITRDNPAAAGTDYGIISYPLATPIGNIADVVELIRMPDVVNISFQYLGITQRVMYTFSNTQRRFANPGCFAAFIGTIAETNFADNASTGMCFGDATSYPSISHPNGDSIDLSHRAVAAERTRIVTAFRDWGFGNIGSGSDRRFATDGADFRNRWHNDHLHSGGFDTNTVEVII